MTLSQSLLPEFDVETANTRKLLERVPETKASWKPHPKSFSLGDLAAHVGNLVTWVNYTLEKTELDLNPTGEAPLKSPGFTSTRELVEQFDANVIKARSAIAAAADGDYMVPWTLKKAGTEIMTLPRVVVLRSFVLNHLIHHRAQLTVYMRMNNVPLPSLYGPTADEN